MQQKKTNYITPKGHQKLVDELNHLLRVERPETTRVIQWAAGNGDRSENADYIYGKRRLRQIDSRLRFLQKRIDSAQIIDPVSIKSDVVKFGATVRVETDSGEIKTYSIIGADEIDLSKNHISWKSPIGNALLGLGVGDSAHLRTPNKEYELEVIEISFKEIPHK